MSMCTTGSRSYVASFNSLKVDKFNNQDLSPIDFYKETHTRSKDGTMSADAQEAYFAMEEKRRETHSEGAEPMFDIQIVEDVLKETSASSTFLASMGYPSSSRRSGSSASSARIRELEERIEEQERQARQAGDRYQDELCTRLQAQERILQEMQRRQQEEMEAVKKSQHDMLEALQKEKEIDALLGFLMRTQGSSQQFQLLQSPTAFMPNSDAA